MSSAIVSHTGGFVTPDSGTWQFEGEIFTQGWSDQEVLLYIDTLVSSIGMGGGTTIQYECASTGHTYTLPAPYFTACFPIGSGSRVEAGDPDGNRIRYKIVGGSTARGSLSVHASSHDVFDRPADEGTTNSIGGIPTGPAVPPDLAVGDLIIFSIGAFKGTAPITAPSGYTLLGEDWAASGDSNTPLSLHVYYKIAEAADLITGPTTIPDVAYSDIFADTGAWTNTTAPEDSGISHLDTTGADATLDGRDITTVNALAIGFAVTSYLNSPPVITPDGWSGTTQRVYSQNAEIVNYVGFSSMRGSYQSRYRPPTTPGEPRWFTSLSGIVGIDFVLPTTETNIEVTDSLTGTIPGRGNVGIVAVGNVP